MVRWAWSGAAASAAPRARDRASRWFMGGGPEWGGCAVARRRGRYGPAQGNGGPGPDASFFRSGACTPCAARGSVGSGRERRSEEDEMPAWTKKDERKYEHVKDSELDRGVGEERA